MNKTIYFPAISGGPNLMSFKKNSIHKYSKKNFKFYCEDNYIFRHKYMLMSAGYNYKNNTKKELGYDLNKMIMLGDSGGYQLATGVLKFDNEIVKKIFDWLENNTNYAINIDFPPYVSNQNTVADFNTIFNERLKISVENFKYFEKNQSGKTRYLNVIHGRDEKRINNWYDSVKDFDFRGGWSIGGATINLFYLLYLFFFLFHKKEIEKFSKISNSLIHILGYSKLFSLPYVFYLQKKLNKIGLDINISYDSSVSIIAAAFGHYGIFYNKTGIKYMDITNKILIEKRNINLDANLPCLCPICKNMKFKDLFEFVSKNGKGFNVDFYNYVSMHNLYKFLEYKTNIENIIFADEKTMLDSIFNTKDFIIFDLIDKAFEDKDPPSFILRNRNVISEVDNSNEEIKTNINKFIQF